MHLNFFCDIDGTLLPFGKGIPDSTLLAIEKAGRAGHRFFLSTGRSPAEVDPRLSAIKFDGGVYSNGATVVLGDSVISARRMTGEENAFLLDYAGRKGCLFMVQSDKGTLLTDDSLDFFISGMKKAFGRVIDVPNLIVTDDFSLSALPPVCKFLFFSPDHRMDEVRRELGQDFLVVDNTVGLPQSDMAEICMKGLNKGTGIGVMMKALGEDMKYSVALGDGANDIEMLSAAGLGIAMGNADDEVKSHAGWVTSSVDDDGFSLAVEYALSRPDFS